MSLAAEFARGKFFETVLLIILFTGLNINHPIQKLQILRELSHIALTTCPSFFHKR